MTFTRRTRGSRAGPGALVLLVALALFVAACGGTDGTPAASTPSATGSPSGEPGPTDEPTEAPSEEPTDQSTEPPTEQPTEPATEAPSVEPTPTTAPSGTPGSAAACTGNDNNLAWYEGLAQAVAWDVYCPVLPTGWFVVSGNYSLRGGGKMEIAYKGPAGARLELREGNYCAGAADCIPAGPDAGPVSFGDRPARLVDVGGGAWLVVAEGGDVNWEVQGTGLDGAVLAGFAALFAKVDG